MLACLLLFYIIFSALRKNERDCCSRAANTNVNVNTQDSTERQSRKLTFSKEKNTKGITMPRHVLKPIRSV
ncbi:hypothetical protein BGW80DRAFT_1334356 [Lactifluus volemus]|nr:hypothetical protein BGW80DRAFT_1334356 [Lactifluus volemus]